MIADAEQHRDEDRRLRELVDARNELDTAAYQVERRLAELGDAVPVHEKARAEMLVADARQALEGRQAPLDRLASLTGELQQIYQELARGGWRPRRRGRRGRPQAAPATAAAAGRRRDRCRVHAPASERQ